VHTVAIVASPTSVHTLQIIKKKKENSYPWDERDRDIWFGKDEEGKRMRVSSPDLAAFGTISGLNREMYQLVFENMEMA